MGTSSGIPIRGLENVVVAIGDSFVKGSGSLTGIGDDVADPFSRASTLAWVSRCFILMISLMEVSAIAMKSVMAGLVELSWN